MHEQGKLDARQRLAALFDAGSFLELGTLVGNKADIPATASSAASARSTAGRCSPARGVTAPTTIGR